MEQLQQIFAFIGAAIPIGSFGALAWAVFLYVKNKGTIEALKEAASTYKTLAEAKTKEVELLEEIAVKREAEMVELKALIEIQKTGLTMAIDELTKSFIKNGVCARANSCNDFSGRK